jgi:hypothetical protein
MTKGLAGNFPNGFIELAIGSGSFYGIDPLSGANRGCYPLQPSGQILTFPPPRQRRSAGFSRLFQAEWPRVSVLFIAGIKRRYSRTNDHYRSG